MLEAIVIISLTFVFGIGIGYVAGYHIGSKSVAKPEPETFDPEPVIVSSYWTEDATDDC